MGSQSQKERNSLKKNKILKERCKITKKNKPHRDEKIKRSLDPVFYCVEFEFFGC